MDISRSELLRPVLPDEALYGLPGDIARTLSETSGADPASILTMFLTMFGNAIGRQPHVTFYGHDEPARLFTLIVGKWARGRKGTSYNAVSKLFIHSEPEWVAQRVESGLQSPEAMIEAVADAPNGDPRLLILETEFARLISTMSANKRFSSQLRRAYDGDVLSRRRVRQAPLISTQHNISMLGMITPGELIALQKLSGGLESRMLYVYSAPAKKTDTDPFHESMSEVELAERVREAINSAWDAILSNTDPISAELAEMRGIAPNSKFRISDDVMDHWLSDIAPEIEELADDIGEDFDRYTARGQTQVVRLALAYALADQSPEVDWPHVRAAMALWEFCAMSARRIFSVPDSPEPRINPTQSGRVFDYLMDAFPEWTTTKTITKVVLSNNGSASVILEDLERQGLVEGRKIRNAGPGRPAIEYRIIELSS